MKFRRSRLWQRLALLVCVCTFVGAGYWLWTTAQELLAFPSQPGTGTSGAITIEVPRGASFPDVLALLVEHEVIARDRALYFKLFVLHRGAAGKITAGEHHVRGDMTPEQLLAELQRSQPATEIRVTIPEGKNTLEIAGILARAGLGDKDALFAATRSPKLLQDLPEGVKNVEGYLFPDTYKFSAKAQPEQILGKMIERHHQVYSDLRRRHRESADELSRLFDWSDFQILTMASLVEKETGAAHERPLIAGVFFNRLRFASFKPKLLQTDPTIIYGCTVPPEVSKACEQFEGRIRRIHLRDPENPYNTYTHEGLPPGPITNPGRAALEAVFAPKKSRFLYFVSRNDGTHQFSRTRADHEAAVDKYIRGGAVGDGSAAGSDEE